MQIEDNVVGWTDQPDDIQAHSIFEELDNRLTYKSL